MIKTVLRNLINNAISYTNLGGKVTISAKKISSSDDKKQNLLEVSVEDTGIGIHKDNLKKLFRIDVKTKSITGLTTTIFRFIPI